jgi:RHS repeat-associated protein
VWGIDYIDSLVARDWQLSGTPVRHYALNDGMSVTAIVNTSGVVQERYGYDSFGTSRVMDASFGALTDSAYGWETRFAGYRLDVGTKMYQVRFRYYHSGLGRWLSRDPIAEEGGANLYAYVANEPGSLKDPFGLVIYPTDFVGPLNLGDQAGFTQHQYDQINQVIADEARRRASGDTHATPHTALRASNTLPGGGMAADFNSDGSGLNKNIMIPGMGEFDFDWFSDINASSCLGLGKTLPYTGLKSGWSGIRGLAGDPIGNSLPFADPGEVNALAAAVGGKGYGDILTPSVLDRFKPNPAMPTRAEPFPPSPMRPSGSHQLGPFGPTGSGSMIRTGY